MFNLILNFLKGWKTTYRKDNLNIRQVLITRNQLNLLCNIYKHSPVKLNTICNFCNSNFDKWWSQHASPVEPELGTAQPQLVLNFSYCLGIIKVILWNIIFKIYFQQHNETKQQNKKWPWWWVVRNLIPCCSDTPHSD